jgi:hypothetical protein
MAPEADPTDPRQKSHTHPGKKRPCAAFFRLIGRHQILAELESMIKADGGRGNVRALAQ